jgi:hypothetical protein
MSKTEKDCSHGNIWTARFHTDTSLINVRITIQFLPQRFGNRERV